ncbi:dual specificity protein kinase YAK1 homolog isoform X2 [Phragmites australis]|uniref:dual specificity protein kinase YAK1 homolog isoform X2 n=1 Tax=Phragmites australis TaxID=29695 RepID=UPI002D79881E|nr:dual specificity protein kinase YAK1 homolog isoform X2 [Phragmites australis]
MEEHGREEDAPGPSWAPSDSTAFRAFAAAVGERAEASPSAPGYGVASRSSYLRTVRKRPFVARLTTDIVQTFEKCNTEFKYSESLNPKRFLTYPAVPVHNDGLDNANSDLILYANLELVNKKSSRRYVVQEMLGQGTFGQVAKCWDAETNNYVAVKVIKNQPAFYQQAIMEVSLLSVLNEKFDPDDQHHIVRMLDFFLCQNHLCIAFEMLGRNLYELLKRNSLMGLQMKYVRTFSRQILDALVAMKDAGIIHCDLKPENILIAPTVKTAAGVKVIDFGSACMEGKTIYSYIQSRYYRSPEVLLGYPYTTAIDMWSFGCIVAELYIGLPLFPGASEYDVLCRMIEILGGQPPDDLLRAAKNTGRFFKHVGSIYPGSEARNGADSAYRILTEEEIEARDSKKPKVGRWYFPRGRLDRLIFTYPWKNLSEENLPETEKADCLALVDFLRGLVEFDPNKRWSPLQASYHPFITGEVFTGPYEPVQETPRIPVGRAAVVDHNPGRGHLLGVGLSPQIGSINRCLRFNNTLQPKMPFSYGSSCGSFGSHGSFNDNAGLASSYGSYDFNSVNIYNSPMDPSGFDLHSQAGGSFLGSSQDIRRRPHLSHGGGIRLSPGGPRPMSLGASPSQFTPPNSHMQIPTVGSGKYGTSPARGGHGSLGKAAAVGQYNRRRNQGYPPMPMPPHEHASQQIQGHQGDVINAARFDAYGRENFGYIQNALPNFGHFSWRPQRGVGSGLPSDPCSGSFPPTKYNGFPPLHSSDVSADTLPSTSSVLDPADWDPNYSDESLLQEDHSLSAELSGLHLRDASGQTKRSSRLAPIQSSNPSSLNQRSGHLFHASSLEESTHPTGHVTFDGYNHANYSQQSFPNYRGQPFQQYNNVTSSYIRPMRSHHNGRPVWTNYSLAELPPTTMGEGMPRGGRASHSFAASGLPPSIARKDFGRIFLS